MTSGYRWPRQPPANAACCLWTGLPTSGCMMCWQHTPQSNLSLSTNPVRWRDLVWPLQGTKRREYSVSCPFWRRIWYSVFPAFTIDGYLAVRAVEGSVDGLEVFDSLSMMWASQIIYISIRSSHIQLSSFPHEFFPCSVTLLDNCGTHKGQALTEVVEASGCIGSTDFDLDIR